MVILPYPEKIERSWFKRYPDNHDFTKKARETLTTEYAPRVEALSDEDLLIGTLALAGGDDYDGCYTAFGALLYTLYREELEYRFLDRGERADD